MSDYISRDDTLTKLCDYICGELVDPCNSQKDCKFYKIIKSLEPADVVPICQTGCKGCKREYNLVVGSCRLCARFYKDMYEGVEY